jgi:hypothetical protein
MLVPAMIAVQVLKNMISSISWETNATLCYRLWIVDPYFKAIH